MNEWMTSATVGEFWNKSDTLGSLCPSLFCIMFCEKWVEGGDLKTTQSGLIFSETEFLVNW